MIRTVERYAFLAGVLGLLANVLLIALYVSFLPGLSSYSWTGPANDVVGGIVGSLAMIPVLLGLLRVVAATPALVLATRVAVAMLAVGALSSLLLVLQVVSFEVSVFVAIPMIVALFAWFLVLGRSADLPGALSRRARLMGTAGLAAIPIGLLALIPADPVRYAAGGLALLIGLPVYLYTPVWFLQLSNASRSGS
ncbi:hypothetical protein AB0M20_41625, partial [Actinoplanes sp. NPDC051633]|uniref:hypothetical protein n=1 Tax=Actinoplanes sp. NPDC051633 TaxID=3155670 RepID=UPI003430A38A